MKFFENKTSSDLLILVLALISVSIHLLVISNLEYHGDELLYFSLGQHLWQKNWEVLDMPPFLLHWDF